MITRKQIVRFFVQNGALALRVGLLRLAGKLFVPNYRFKWPQLDWWKDGEFTRYLGRFGELSLLNTDRKWMVYQLLRVVANVPGDTAECGVFQGATSYLICSANKKSALRKTHHVFDSFEGLSEPGPTDGSHWSKGDLKCDMKSVQQTLSEFSHVEFHPGWIPERFSDVAGQRFSFVHVDVDLAEPTVASVAFFYERMNAGGIIVCDDYGQGTSPGATEAIDRFLADKPEKMLALPDGGGFLIANIPTAERFSLE